jgi:hypothetical protein
MILAMDGATRDDLREALGHGRADFDRCFSYLLWQGFCSEVYGAGGTSPTVTTTEKGERFLRLMNDLDIIAHSNARVASF